MSSATINLVKKMGGAGEDTDFSLCKSGLGQGTHFTA